MLHHPSQLYEAFLEGLVLFVILWILRNKRSAVSGKLLVVYLFGYEFFRFFVEFFRQPDAQSGLFFGWLTLGQIFSAMAIIAAVFIILARKKSGISQYSKNSL